jgi:hypothetical protein
MSFGKPEPGELECLGQAEEKSRRCFCESVCILVIPAVEAQLSAAVNKGVTVSFSVINLVPVVLCFQCAGCVVLEVV